MCHKTKLQYKLFINYTNYKIIYKIIKYIKLQSELMVLIRKKKITKEIFQRKNGFCGDCFFFIAIACTVNNRTIEKNFLRYG